MNESATVHLHSRAHVERTRANLVSAPCVINTCERNTHKSLRFCDHAREVRVMHHTHVCAYDASNAQTALSNRTTTCVCDRDSY